MRKVALCIASVLLAGGPAFAQAKVAVDQSRNWDAFMKLYPKRALEAGQQGLVGFTISIDRSGQPTACQVTHTSGYKELDDETCNLLMAHAVFQPPRDVAGNRLNEMNTHGVINWRIPGKQGPTEAVKVAALNPLDKKVCKRTPRTGTLAGFDRVCMTARDWDKTRREAVDRFEEGRNQGFTAGKQ